MKILTLILASVLFIQAEGYFIRVQNTPTNSKIVPVGRVHIQKLLLPLFENVCEVSTEPIIARLNEEFKLDPTIGNYLKPEVINNFLNLKATKGLLAKGDIFTEYDSDHNNELKIVYEVLYYARDFDTFYKAACWARQNLNCGLFVDAIYLAVITRRDTEKVSVPPPYELLPNYFIRKDFITKASSLIRGKDIATDTIRNEGNAYILDVNYTTNFNDDGDDKLAYFHEDVGLNSYYFLTKLKQNQWLNDIGYLQNNNGKYIYHTMKQLMTRYNLERYSNGLPELEGIDWDNIYDLPYDPMLVYSNGNSFNERTPINNNNEIISLLKNIESNLPTAVIHMRDNGYNKSEILNHIMEILVTSENSYENLAIKILSDKDSGSSSVLGHYLTRVRDPIFWRLNKKIVDMIDNCLSVLPRYTRNQLYFPGVEIQNIEVKNILTLFDNFEFDATDALKTDGEETKFQIKIAQSRLNHKPFAIKINIASLVAQKALVKIYIGPKVLPGEFADKKNLFMFLDCFEASLKLGPNILSRKSNEMTNLSEDLLSISVIHKNVLDTEFGIDALTLKSVWSQIQFPSRLILPKGTSSGLPFQLFVFVAPYVLANAGVSRTNVEVNLEALNSPECPLDLDMEIKHLFSLPNAFVKDIIITHKTESTSANNKPINTFNKGFNERTSPMEENDYRKPNGLLALAAQPAFTKNPFDYQSKKNQFGKRPNFSYKKTDTYKEVKTPEQSDQTDDLTTVKVENQSKNIEFNNRYMTHQIDPKVTKYKNENGYRYILDKDNINKDLQKKLIEEVNNEINVIPLNETDDKNVANTVILYKEDDINNMNNDLLKEAIEEVNNNTNVISHKETNDKYVVNNVSLDKGDDGNNMNDNSLNDVSEEINNKINVIPHKETDNVILDKEDDVNNILHERFNTKFDVVQKVDEDTNGLDKYNKNINFDNKENEQINNNKVPAHGLFTMPRKRYSNFFKIVFAQKPETDERVYI